MARWLNVPGSKTFLGRSQNKSPAALDHTAHVINSEQQCMEAKPGVKVWQGVPIQNTVEVTTQSAGYPLI
jgi:hypothetical protein